MRQLLIFLTAVLLNASSAQTQSPAEPSTYTGTPDPEVVLQWLHSPDPRLQAWAAHDILESRSIDLIPDLQSLLERSTPATLSEAARIANFRTTLALLDTFIQLGAAVPAPTLERLEKLGYNAQTEELVLLSRLPWEEAEPAVHAFYRPSGSNGPPESRVAAQMLAQHSSKGFAAQLLSTIVVTGHIFVQNADGSGGLGFGSGSSSCCGVGSGAMSSDWPQIGRYSFRDPPRDLAGKDPQLPKDESLFLAAPDPVYLLRSVSRHYGASPCGGLSPLNDAIRSHLVGTLLNHSPASPFPEQPVDISILFQSRESYRAQVQAFVDGQQENFYQVASALTAMDLLTEEERQSASLRINLSVQDLRTQPAEDLPAIAFRPPIEWTPAF